MSEVSSWILSIAGIICVSVLIELLMPEGQMNKYIKSIFSFVIILVIILPLPKVLNKDVDISNMFEYREITLQEDYLYQQNIRKISAITKSIEEDLNSGGYDGIKLSISADFLGKNVDYKTIYVDLKNLVIQENSEHKNILEIEEDIKIIIDNYISDGEVIFEI